MFVRCELLKQFFRGRNDPSTYRSLAQRLAQPGGNASAVDSDLLRVSLLPRNPRRKSIDWVGHRFPDPDVDLHAAEPSRNRLDRAKFLGFPGYRICGDFSAGAAAWFGCAWRASD